MMEALRDLTYDVAKTYVGDVFQIRFEGGESIDLNLERVLLLMEKHVNPRMKRDAFSLQFRGPRNIRLTQSMYPLFHDKMGGPLPIFLVPIGSAEEGLLYEAVFN